MGDKYKWKWICHEDMFGIARGHEDGVNMLSHLFCKRGGVIRPKNSGQAAFKRGNGNIALSVPMIQKYLLVSYQKGQQ